jgi:hypothetical protein
VNTVYKYPLDFSKANTTTIQIHDFADILKCAIQGEGVFNIYLWANVQTELSLIERHFAIVGTGWELPKNTKYIDTIFDGDFVWHIYELLGG